MNNSSIQAFSSFAVQALRGSLKLLVMARAVLLLCAVAFSLMTEGLPIRHSEWISISILVIWVVISSGRLARHTSFDQNEYMVVLALDVLLLAWMISHFGGAANPVISALLIPVLISAVLLKPLQLAWVSVLSIVVYGAVFMLDAGSYGDHMYAHLLGMWWVFSATVGLACPLLSYLVSQLATQVELVAELKRQKLRDQQIMAVAGLAAVTVHELSTPLSTMQMCIEMLEDTDDENPHVPVLQAQIDQCRHVLAQLRKQASIETDAPDEVSVESWVESLLKTTFHLMPYRVVDWQVDLAMAKRPIMVCPSVTTACLNLLLNAIKACTGPISLRWAFTPRCWSLSIAHRCDVVDEEVIGSLGNGFVSSVSGMGLGATVSSWAIEHKGGTVMFQPLPSGAIETTVQIPWVIA